MLESPNVKKRNNKCVIRGDAQIKLKKKKYIYKGTKCKWADYALNIMRNRKKKQESSRQR